MSKPRGGVHTDWSMLAGSVGQNSTVDGGGVVPGRAPASVPLGDLVPNPHNPRDSVGDLAELESIVDTQLQPAVVVTRAAFQALFPNAEVAGKWVVIIGNRRLAAALKFGRPELDVIVRDELARDRETLLAAVISENVDRKSFDYMEEAKAVEQLVRECGTATLAKERLKKSDTWISQRRKLLELDPTLQDAVRRGDLAIRDARELAKLPREEQVEVWLRSAALKGGGGGAGAGEGSGKGSTAGDSALSGPPRARSLSRALKRFSTDPSALVAALYDELGEGGARTLVSLLRKQLQK